MTTPYQPSNNTDGEVFKSKFCYQCARYSNDPEKACKIELHSMAYRIGDKNYPVEWIRDESGKPTCTAFATEQELKQERYMDEQRKLEAQGQQRLL